MNTQDYKSFKGGQRWRVLPDGRIEVEHEGAIRTQGEPLSIRRLLDEHGAVISAACECFDIPLEWLLGMIPIEARKIRASGGGVRFDPVSLRHEPGYESDTETPHRVSAGLMQTLLSTAQSMARKHDLAEPRTASDLYDPGVSVMLGAAYCAHQRDRYAKGVEGHSFDFVHLTGAYNAGGVYFNRTTPFKLRTYSPSRTERAIRWHNDALAVLKERSLS